MNDLEILIKERLGGVADVSKVCGITPKAIYKWIKNGRLPRTEYTGETNYCELLELHTGVPKSEILRCGKSPYLQKTS